MTPDLALLEPPPSLRVAGGDLPAPERLDGRGRVWRLHLPRPVVAKIVPPAAPDPADWGWHEPAREVLAYLTGLVDVFAPLLRAATCHGAVVHPGGRTVLWLDDPSPRSPPRWTPSLLAAVAGRLGRSQGRLAQAPPATRPWHNTIRLVELVGARGDEPELLARGNAPLPKDVPRRALDTVRAVWQEPQPVVAAVAAAPRTWCHLDLHPGNVLATSDGPVLVDWACAGVGAVGEDAANLVATAGLDLHVPPAEVAAVYRAVVEAYAAGVAHAGLLSPDEVRRAVDTALVATFAWVLPELARSLRAGETTLGGRPLAAALPGWGAVAALVADVAGSRTWFEQAGIGGGTSTPAVYA